MGSGPLDSVEDVLAGLCRPLDDFTERVITDDAFCRIIDEAVPVFEGLYLGEHEDEDADPADLFWMFMSDATLRCKRMRAGKETVDEARDYLRRWRPYLSLGAAAWRSRVESGLWPFDED